MRNLEYKIEQYIKNKMLGYVFQMFAIFCSGKKNGSENFSKNLDTKELENAFKYSQL